MTSAVFFSFITSLFICMALIPPLQLNAGRWSFMDHPGERKVHANPIPRVGGIAFGFAALLSIFFWVPQDPIIAPVLASAAILLGFGIWDDRANLNYRTKLLGQLLAVLVVVVIGQIRFEQIPFLYEEEAPLWLTVPLTVIFLVGASNAVNLSDGLDGLAGGLAFLSFAGIAYLAYLSHDTTVLVLAAGAWWVLRHPALSIGRIVVQGDLVHNNAVTLRANVAPRLMQSGTIQAPRIGEVLHQCCVPPACAISLSIDENMVTVVHHACAAIQDDTGEQLRHIARVEPDVGLWISQCLAQGSLERHGQCGRLIRRRYGPFHNLL